MELTTAIKKIEELNNEKDKINTSIHTFSIIVIFYSLTQLIYIYICRYHVW
jgi:hypothetical protein